MTTDSEKWDEQVMSVYRLGAEAHDSGVSLAACPLGDGVFLHAWKAGWCKAQLISLGIDVSFPAWKAKVLP